jgi:hypothetical protein
MGGLEPIPDTRPIASGIYYTGTEYQDFLADYVGRPVTQNYIQDMQRRLYESITDRTTVVVAGRPNRNRTVFRDAHSAAYAMIGERATRGRRSEHMYISAEAPPWSMSYLDTGLPVGRVEESYSDTVYDDFTAMTGDWWAWLNGEITHEEYQKREKIRELEKKEHVSNKEAKFVLEKEY